MGTLTAAADGSHMQGAMIALIPTREDAARLAIEGGETADQLHLTLRYLGKGAAFDDDARAAITDSVRMLAEGMPPITSKVFGAAHWNGGGDEPSWVWSVGDGPEHGHSLEAAHGMAEEALLMAPMDVELPAPHTPWVAHICAAYSPDPALLPELEARLGDVTFDRVRVAFAGDHTDIPLGPVTAAGARTAAAGSPLRRNLTDLETASHCDFAQMDADWRAAVAGTVEAWADIQKAQRTQITAAVQAAVDAEDLDRLDTLTVDTADGAALLAARMLAYARTAGRALQAEAEAQGVDVPEWSLEDDAVTAAAFRDRLRQVARTTARYLGVGLVQSAVRQVARLWGSGSGEQVAAAVDEHLDGLSGAAVEEQVGAAMSAAQNEGRMAVMQAAPQARYVASEVLDRNCCKPCRKVDATEYPDLAAARRDYPSGGYTRCQGGARCRGTLVAIWDQGGGAAAALAAGEGVLRNEAALAAATISDQTSEQGGTVRCSIVQDHPDCGADTPWAVVGDEGGELMGCYATEAEADQARAAMAEDSDDEESEEEADGMAGATAPWEGPLAIEGQVTGDGREFAPDALTWADLPVPLRWNKEDSHGGEPTTVAVNVGRIDRIWRDGNRIMGAGVLDLSDEDGRRVYGKIKGKFLRGVSIDADSIGDADVEFVWPESIDTGENGDEEADLLEMLFAQPEKVIFHGGRIRAATLVDIPAFAEAYIALLDDQGAVVAGGQPVTQAELQALTVQELGAVAVHTTATSDSEWDGAANEKRLDAPLTVARARAAYAWYDGGAEADGELPKSACRFLHHEIAPDGTVGPANLAACSAAIAALHGARGGTTIPDADRRGVYDHVAAHLRDAGREPAPFSSLPSLAAGAMDLDWRPPAEWFTDPGLPDYTGIVVTDHGRVFGHAAPWGSCHIGFDNECITAPRENEHPHFMTGEVVCADGKRQAVGQITVGTGHAPLHYGAMPAAEHYDNTGSAVADVAVGNDKHGIWVAGSIRPHADPLSVYELRASGRVSGDWRRIGGQLRLVGLLGVNVAGFQGEPRMRARVASGRPQALVAAGMSSGGWSSTQRQVEQQAMRIVMAMLRDRVHGRG